MSDDVKSGDVITAVHVLAAIAETIRALGDDPSGELYARVMDKLSLEQYQRVIATLKGAALVTEEHHLRSIHAYLRRC